MKILHFVISVIILGILLWIVWIIDVSGLETIYSQKIPDIAQVNCFLEGNTFIDYQCEITPQIYLKEQCRKYGIDYNLAHTIINCESDWQSKVCSFPGCHAGMGIFQIIPTTKQYCENKLGRKLNVFNYVDNIDCGLWLLKNEGCRHWKPSAHCHKCY